VQGQAKLAVVIEAFARTAKMEVTPQLRRLTEDARRTTVRMVADEDGVLGFRAHESHDIVPVSQCMVAHPLINEFISQPVLEGAGEVTIRVGARTNNIGVWCHEGKLANGLPAGLKTGERATVSEVVGDHTYKVSMGSFFQSSPEAAELIIDSVVLILWVSKAATWWTHMAALVSSALRSHIVSTNCYWLNHQSLRVEMRCATLLIVPPQSSRKIWTSGIPWRLMW